MLEGFATYISHLYMVEAGLDSPSDPVALYDVLRVTDAKGPAEVAIEDLFGLSVYFRGGMALYAVDTAVGRETFVEILRAYYEQNAGESVSTEEFQAIVAEIGGDEAADVLDEWLFGAELPAFPG